MFRSLFILTLLSLSQAQAFALSPDLRAVLEAMRPPFAKLPVVITDLDETIVDSTARRFFGLMDAGTESCATRDRHCGVLQGLNLAELLSVHNRYDISSFLGSFGIGPSHWRAHIEKRSLDIYLSGKYLELDQAIPGAVEFVGSLREQGAVVFYVSSRFEDTQLAGTLQSLKRIGFIEPGEEERVILRPRGKSSIDFKRSSFARVAAWAEKHKGEVLLVMENEPENMNAMSEMFPKAQGIFVDGAVLKPEPLKGTPLRIKTYR